MRLITRSRPGRSYERE
jgi:hypothetical protein